MSSILDPVAQKIADIVTNLNLTPAVKGYKWGRLDLDSIPAGVIGMPDFARTGVDHKERQLGTNDWMLTYPVLLCLELTEAVANQAQLIDLVEAFVAAVDADPSLGSSVLDAKVVAGTPYVDQQLARPLIGYECHVEALKLTSL